MKIPDRVIGVATWSLENGHRTLLKLSGGRFPKSVMGMQPVELHVTGRRSGKRYSTMLTAPIHEPDRIVLIASKGGSQDHPDWYKNLSANPDVEITVDGVTRQMRARTASGEERERLWSEALKAYSGYAGYQNNTSRQIPVVVCEPRG